jgi:sorting nexin-29
VVANLQEELKESRRKISETSEKLGNRIQTLSRENELLKHQLKKYVGAVQKLRDGPMAYETVSQRPNMLYICL